MNQVATIHQSTEIRPMTAVEIQAQVNTIQQVMRQVMKEGTHFGMIPGTKENSLYKPGAEKIMATFRLSGKPEVIDLSTPDKIHYRVMVTLTSPTGVTVGYGIGECSSDEEKYRWRSAVCPQEFDETPLDRRREKWRKGWRDKPAYKQQQVRTEPADLANTILKMAKKRALVDGVLTSTAASDIFTQDIEDLPPEYVESMEPGHQAPAPRSTEKPPYPDEQLEKNKSSWADLIESSTKTPAEIIATVRSKYALSDEQVKTINGLVIADQGEIQI